MIILTDPAKKQIETQLKKRGLGLGIRLGVKPTGCSGLSYVLEFVDVPDQTDNKYDFGTFSVFVDPKSLVYISGMEVDFVKEGLNEGFKFNNSNEKGRCGCGESFTV